MAIFARSHYQAIAEELKKLLYSPFIEDDDTVKTVARGLSNLFLRDNPNFNREKFLKACGMEE